MIQLTVELETEGSPFVWDVGSFPSRADAEGAAAVIEKETAQAAEDGEDVTFLVARFTEAS